MPFKKKKLMISAASIASFALIMTLTFGLLYTPAYAVSMDGEQLGVVSDTETAQRAVESAQAEVENAIGVSAVITDDISIGWTMASKNDLVSEEELTERLLEQVEEIREGYVLSVGGQAVGFSPDRETLDSMLDELSAPYQNESTKEVRFEPEVSIEYGHASTEIPDDPEQIYAALTANSVEAASYTVAAGDTFSEIAAGLDMRQRELSELNPSVDPDVLMIGDVLNIRRAVPFLAVVTVDEVTYTEPISAPVEYVEDDSLYEGDSNVLSEGEEGENWIRAEVTYQNGTEIARTVLEAVVQKEPEKKVVATGTKERPATASKGTYICPVDGTVTSSPGSRTLFGSTNYHSGLDIAVPYGTKVKAADGGTVSFAGWKGDYGNLVIITHDDGTQTYYAHNSNLLVSEGDSVYQGQAIAEAGSTGRSTGSHCHFEVRVNGEVQNPYDYL